MVLSKDNIVVLLVEGSLTITLLSMVIIMSVLSGADKTLLKLKTLLKIFRVGGFSIICCRPGLTELVGFNF